MSRYRSPAPVDAAYVSALGQAIYAFCGLEGMVIHVAERLEPGFIMTDHHTLTAGQIAGRFSAMVARAQGRLPAPVWDRLSCASQGLQHANNLRVNLLHSHPITHVGGEQMLGRRRKDGSFERWDIDKVDAAARFFDTLCQELNTLFHRDLLGQT